MRFVALLAAALCVLFVPASASAIQITGIELYPEAPSASSGFVAVVRATSNASSRVSWMSPEACQDLEDSCYGQFQPSGNAYVCYFSSSDVNASCGPSPFLRSGSAYKFIVYGIDSGPAVKMEKQVTTGTVPLNVFLQTTTNATNSTIKMQVFQLMDTVSYKVYDKSMIEKAAGRLDRNEYGTFVGDIAYNEAYAYIVVTGSGSSGTAGAAVTIPAPQKEQQTELTYSVIAPDVIVRDALITPGKTWKYQTRVTNNGNATIQNLTVKVPDSLKRYMKATLNNSSLATGASTLLNLELSNLQGHLEITSALPMFVGDKQVGEVKTNIMISYLSDGGSSSSAGVLPTVSPSFIDESYELQESTKTITVNNNDASPISITKVTPSLDFRVTANATFPVSDIASGASGRVDIKFAPPAVAGPYSGSLTIETSAGSVTVPMKVTFYSNISQRIEQLAGSLNSSTSGLTAAQKAKLSTAVKSVEDDISSGADSYERGSYADADAYLDIADAKISILDEAADAIKGGAPSTPSGCSCDKTIACQEDCSCDSDCTSTAPSFDPTIIIIVAIVAIGGFGAWYYFKKIRKSGWDGEVEEDF